LITGGSTGIGRATAKQLVEKGRRVLLTSRSPETARSVAAEIGAEGLALDLSSLSSLRGFAEEVIGLAPSLNVVIHNAGAVFPKRTETPEGFDAQFAVIYLGPFLLNHLLLETLKSNGPSRIINVASDLHRNVSMDFDDLQSEKKYNFLTSYSRAELAKVMGTYDLARRVDPEEVSVHCLHPGGVRTKLFRNFRGPLGWLIWLSNWLKMSPSAGARTSVFLATSESVEHGAYYVKCRPRKSSKASYDQEAQERLRKVSMELAGI
jgi:NAD(P)-dependent dehydrogenase (short-subunit alcohol dehydrogenase family)